MEDCCNPSVTNAAVARILPLSASCPYMWLKMYFLRYIGRIISKKLEIIFLYNVGSHHILVLEASEMDLSYRPIVSVAMI